MTNLLEKSLITGFGIFTLMIFFILVSPFFAEIADFRENEEENMKEWEKESDEKEKEDESAEDEEDKENNKYFHSFVEFNNLYKSILQYFECI